MDKQTAAAGRVAVLGIDVGKTSHWACALTAGGEVAFSGPLPNRAEGIDGLLERAGRQALVVVDQLRNVGLLAVRRAQLAGNAVAYLPGLAMSRARDMLPGAAKTDRIDAEVIARAALGMPGALRAVPAEDGLTASLRALSARREASARARNAEVNRLRAGLLELDPALEAAVDPSRRWQLAAIAEFGSPAAAAARARGPGARWPSARTGRPGRPPTPCWGPCGSATRPGGAGRPPRRSRSGWRRATPSRWETRSTSSTAR